MSVLRHDIDIPRLSQVELDAWAEIPAAVVSDCLGRAHAMIAAIGPLAPTMKLVAQARTVACMAADNSALHGAIGCCEPGDALVCDGQGFEEVALWGGLMTGSALEAKIAGLVIDGAVRDSLEIIEAGFPCFSRAVVPRGPHKGFGGVIDGPISCGGLSVSPGDLVIGDCDGVTVVPFGRIAETLAAARARLEKEAQAMEEVAKGGSLAEIYGAPAVTLIKG